MTSYFKPVSMDTLLIRSRQEFEENTPASWREMYILEGIVSEKANVDIFQCLVSKIQNVKDFAHN